MINSKKRMSNYKNWQQRFGNICIGVMKRQLIEIEAYPIKKAKIKTTGKPVG